MGKVFEIRAYRGELPELSVELVLPATSYELADMLEQLGEEDIDALDHKIEDDLGVEFLSKVIAEEVTVKQLDHIARKVSQMDDRQLTALEGLVKMECQKRQSSHLDFSQLFWLAENTDHCHVVNEVRNDSQLGRFYAENGFVEGADDLPDRLFEMLDFGKIGREMRVAEGGVFTSGGYVVCHERLPESRQLPETDQTPSPGFQMGGMGGM